MTHAVLTDRGTPNIERVAELLEQLGTTVIEPADEAAADARVLVAGGFTRVDAGLLDRLSGVRAVFRTGAGYDNVDTLELRRRRVSLIAPRLESTPSVAEYVFGALITVLRGIREADAAVRAGDWDFRARFHGSLLHGRVLGIVGVGRVGRQAATLGDAFGMRVVAWHPWSARDLGPRIERVNSFDELLAMADVLTLHCRLEPETKHLVSAVALAKLKRGAIVVNTGRGELVDEAALADALEMGTVGAAVIDTFAGEPDLTRTPLRRSGHALLSPHIAGHTAESTEAVARFVAEAVTAFVTDSELPRDFVVLRP